VSGEATNARLQVVIDGRGAQEGARVVSRSLDEIERKAARSVSAVETLRSSFAGLALKLGAFLGVTAGFSTMIQNTITAERALAKMQGVIKSTGGVAGRTSEQLEAFSAALQKSTIYGDDVIQEGMALLLTFRNIRGEVFDRTTKAALDMATALGMDLTSAMQMLGRAVNDPSTGLMMLSRVGVRISAPVQQAIKDLVASGDIVRAQNLVLDEMEKRFGGLASSMRGTLGGAIQSLKNAFGDLFEMNKLKGVPSLTQQFERLTATLSSEKARQAADAIGGAMLSAINAITKATASLFSFLETHSTAVKVAVYGMVGAFVALKGAVLAIAVAKLVAEFSVWLSLFPAAVKGVSDLVTWLSLFGPVKTLIAGVTGAMETMAFTVKWVLIPALAGLMAYEAFFKKDSYYTAPVGGPNSSRSIPSTLGETRQKLAQQQAQMDQLDVMRLAGLQSGAGGGSAPYDIGGKKGAGGGSSGPSATEQLVTKIRDQIRYLNTEGKAFLPILDSWQKKLKPLSSDWKAIADLSLEIRQNAAQAAAQSVKAELDRIQKAKEEQEELQRIAEETGQATLDLYKSLNASGMMGDAEYLRIVEERMEAIRQKYQQMVGEGVSIRSLLEGDSEYRDLFGEAQSKAVETANSTLETLKGQYDNGRLSVEQYRSALEALLAQYEKFPLAVQAIQSAITGLGQAVENSKTSMSTLVRDAEDALSNKLSGIAGDLADAFAGAIAYGNDLSSVLKRLAQDLAYLALKALILRAISGLFGGGGGLVASSWGPMETWGSTRVGFNYHTGGIVGYEGRMRSLSSLPRFHSGGLSSDEQLAVLKRGEGVFTPEQMRALGRDRDDDTPPAIVMNINALDPRSFIDLMRSNRTVIESLIVENIAKNASVRKAIRGLT